jgi:glucokinase
MKDQTFNVGVDVGGTNIKFGIIDENGKILSQEEERTHAGRGSDAVIATIIRGVDSLLSGSRLRLEQVGSVGLGVPGTADSESGVVIFAPNIFWRNVEVARAIRQAFDVPVYVAQDSRASAWAEYLVGAGKGLRSIASVTLGTGIGCGMVFDGRIFHGALNTAGEFGHQIVELDGDMCNCGRRGCLEAHAGGLSIVRQALETIDGIGVLLQKAPADITVHDVFRLALERNAQAAQLTDRVVRYIGMGLVNLINLNSVELITFSGGISNAPFELLLGPLIEFVRNRAYEFVADKVRICRSDLGEDAPLIGAALLCQEASAQVGRPSF